MVESSPHPAGEHLVLVHRLCHELANAASLDDMFAAVVAMLVEGTGLDRASVLTFDDGGVMRFRSWRNLSDDYRRRFDGHSPWSADTPSPQPILVADVTEHEATREYAAEFEREGIRALAFLPLVARGQLLGKFMLYAAKPTDWDATRLGFARTAADLLAAFILREIAQQRLLQARKMESLGFLAGGIAHDFNNLLTSILGFAEILHSASAPDSLARQSAEELLSVVDQATDLTRQLLGFARPRPLAVEEIDVGALVTEAAAAAEHRAADGIVVRRTIDAPPTHVRANRAQLHQVLRSLGDNALAAMGAGGTLTLAFSRHNSAMVPSGEVAEIAVSDTGIGMDEATRRRVFEPLFTTRRDRHGAGLGLATCYGFVTHMGGEMTVMSAPGRGSTFVVRLPVVEPAAAAQTAAVADAGTTPATVLLVDDHDHVRKAISISLRSRGYRVLDVDSGQKALDLIDTTDVDVVVSDILMPEMDGVTLCANVRRRHPGMPMLLISGYSDGTDEVPADVPVLLKPFQPTDLGRRLAELLARR